MTAFETATQFFHACEGLQGWEGCKDFVADNASFTSQADPLVGVNTVEGYCEWMAGLGLGPLEGCSYDLHNAAWDEGAQTALFFATFNGNHSGEGGPVAATGQDTHSHYVYALTMDDSGKVCSMTKIWNAHWALQELGWG